MVHTSHCAISPIFLVVLFYSILQAAETQKKNLLTENHQLLYIIASSKFHRPHTQKLGTSYASCRTTLSMRMFCQFEHHFAGSYHTCNYSKLSQN